MAESKPRKRKAAKKKAKKTTKKKSPRRKKPQEPKPQFSQEQYDMLLRCSEKGDISEWNEWRRANRVVRIHLQGAVFRNANLQGALLNSANLQGASLWDANLQGADLVAANLQGANLQEANLQGAELNFAHLQGANLQFANLEGAKVWVTNLQGATLFEANLQGAQLSEADLQGARLSWANLRDTDFHMAAVDGETIISEAEIDNKTDFTGVGLDSARVEPGTKQLLKYNIRRLGWQKWYKKHPILRWPVQTFWEMSDYGRSTGRIITCFFILAVIFAGIYLLVGLGCYLWSGGENTGMIANLFEKDGVALPGWLVPWRTLYFSIVTMTTLGFGDIYAAPDSLAGHLVLGLQVLLGYVLLAALVTRFAVLFQAGGPAGKFPGEKSIWDRIKDRLPEVRRKLLAENQRLVRHWEALCRWVKSPHGSGKGGQEDQQGGGEHEQ